MQIISGIQQSVFDIALQYHGSIESALVISFENNLTIDEPVDSNISLTVSDNKHNQFVVNYYNQNRIAPATGTFVDEILDGIGYYIIGSTFQIL